METIGVFLDPDFDLTAKAAPFIERIKLERFYPGRVLEGVLDSGTDVARLLKDLPGGVGEILRQAKQGRVKIGFEHRGLEEFITHLDRLCNRLAFSPLAVALPIGSARMSSANIGSTLWEIPLPGFLGFVIAGILGISLLVSILRSGKLGKRLPGADPYCILNLPRLQSLFYEWDPSSCVRTECHPG